MRCCLAAVAIVGKLGLGGCNALFGLDATERGDDDLDAAVDPDGSRVDALDGRRNDCPFVVEPGAVPVLCTGFDGEPFDQGFVSEVLNGSTDRSARDDAPSAPAVFTSTIAGSLAGGYGRLIAGVDASAGPHGEIRTKVRLDPLCVQADTNTGIRVISVEVIDDDRNEIWAAGLRFGSSSTQLFEATPTGTTDGNQSVELPAVPPDTWTEIRFGIDFTTKQATGKVGPVAISLDLQSLPTDRPPRVAIGLATNAAHGGCTLDFDNTALVTLP